jgi:hypothetical protein
MMESAGDCPGTGVGSRMVSVALASFTKTNLASLCLTNSPGWTGAGGWLPPQLPHRIFFAWDNATRTAYVAAQITRLDSGGNIIAGDVVFAKYVRATNTWTRLATPSLIRPATNLEDLRIAIVWDSVHQKVVWPVKIRGGGQEPVCGLVEQFLVYTPSTDTWTNVPVPFEIHADTQMYSPADDVHVMSGGAFCVRSAGGGRRWGARTTGAPARCSSRPMPGAATALGSGSGSGSCSSWPIARA